MKIRNNVISQVTLIIIQLSFGKAQDINNGHQYSQSDTERINSSLQINSSSLNKENFYIKQNSAIVPGISKKIDSYDVLNQEIDNLTNHVINITNSIMTTINVKSLNSEKKIRFYRSNPPPGFNPPSSSEEQLENLETEIIKLKEIIEAMKNESDNNDTSERLGALETALENLQKLFDDSNRKKLSEMENLKNFVDSLTATVNNLKEKVDGIKKHFDEKQQQEMPERLRSQIIDDINGRDFDNAFRKLQNITSELDKNINIIVHAVYNGQVGNFDRLIQFGDICSPRNIQASLLVYEALFYEMKSNSHNDHQKLLRLINSVQQKIIDVKSTSANELERAKNFKNELFKTVKDLKVSELIKSLENNPYDIFKKDFATFVKFFTSYVDKYPDQSIFAFSSAFYKLKENHLLNQSAIVNLAFGLKRAMGHEVDSKASDEATRLKNDLPTSVRNLAFLNNVCITDGYSEYNHFFLEPSYNLRGDNEYWILAELAVKKKFRTHWIVEPYKDFYRMKNTQCNNYLVASTNGDAWDQQRRNVYCSHLGQHPDDQYNWLFEPNGNEIYIKNAHFNEYIFVDLYKEEFEHSVSWNSVISKPHIFTWREANKITDHSLWKIRNCDED